jgi:acyl-CoA synthetase (AMP-forming)/AMP-acid ligase II
MAGDVREAITSAHGLFAAHVFLVEPGNVPRTSSGKVRRNEARARFAPAASGTPLQF